jgi:hypothetical protein
MVLRVLSGRGHREASMPGAIGDGGAAGRIDVVVWVLLLRSYSSSPTW